MEVCNDFETLRKIDGFRWDVFIDFWKMWVDGEVWDEEGIV